MKPPINTFEDLAISEDVEMILLADNVITMQIMVRPIDYVTLVF
jgi:hypothetical protein